MSARTAVVKSCIIWRYELAFILLAGKVAVIIANAFPVNDPNPSKRHVS